MIQYIDSMIHGTLSGIWYKAWWSEAERIQKILYILKIEYFREISAAALESDNLSLKYAAIQ